MFTFMHVSTIYFVDPLVPTNFSALNIMLQENYNDDLTTSQVESLNIQNLE